jgi:CO/xanthine dehydrogenase Mo-binding subunit
MRSVGRNAPRKEGPQKLCGSARYVDDYHVPGCLHGVTVRAAVPHARIRSVDLDPAFDWSDYVVATARDIPGENAVVLLTHDQPLLADEVIRHQMEPVALIAHADRARAYAAIGHVTIHATPLPAALTIDDALAGSIPVHGDDNIFKELVIERGHVSRALAEADLVVEGVYCVPHQEQAYIENNGIIAWIEDDGTVVVMGSMQCPYYVHKALKAIFAVPDDRIRVIQATTGGGFGGKEEYPNLIAGHAAVLARKAGRPVRMIYDRHEDMVATTKRHPARIHHRTGVTRDGRLVAQDIDIVMDGGAYTTLSPVVLSRGALHATGPYTCPNVRVRARAVATNTPPNGAFRGFGAPQTLFAAELQIEKVAASVGLDSLTVRRRNMVRRGSVLATGQTLRESVGARAVLDAVVDRSRYRQLQRAHATWNRDPDKSTWRGAGLSLVFHGAGFTGRGEVVLQSRASVVLMRDGQFKALAASTEIGQGATTTFVQMTADALGVPADWVDVETPDTWKVPNSGPTVASRTVMIVGGLLQQAATDLRHRVVGARGAWPRRRAAMAALAKRACGAEPFIRCDADYRPPPGIEWDEDAYRGDAYGVYSYAAAVVDLEVDRTTCEVTVRRLTTAQDIGRAINPLLVEGQIIGGTAQGLGYALLELPVYRDGVMQNAQLTNYIIPTAPDMPPVDVALIEQPYSRGPGGGAKGVGELPMDVPAPAVAAAVWRATGAWIPELPLLPERIARGRHAPHAASPPAPAGPARRRSAVAAASTR